MDQIFAPIKWWYLGMVFTYMNNIMIATGNDVALHRQIVHEVLGLLTTKSPFYKLNKCHFEQTLITYLKIIVEVGTICIDPTKLNRLLAWPWKLALVKQVQSMLEVGVFGYHYAFILGYANIVWPINNLLKKDAPFKWMDKHMNTMDQLAHAMASNPILHRHNYDQPFFLEVNTS